MRIGFGYIFVLVFFCFFSMSCNESKTAEAGEKPSPQAVQAPSTKQYTQLPTAPNELLSNLFNNASAIDFIFHNFPFSMSQTEPAAVKGHFTHFAPDPVKNFPGDCKPMARIFYQINGEIVQEVDLYYADKCKYFVFVDGSKPMYANSMSEAGDQFFNRILVNALKTAQQGPPGGQ